MGISDWSSDVCSSDLRAGPGAVRLAAADEDRRATIAVTGGAATLLATELLAGAGDVRPFARGAGRSTAICELPVDDAEQNVGARLKTENLVVELDVAGGLCVRSEEHTSELQSLMRISYAVFCLTK